MSQELLYQVDDDIATITFNRPERMSARSHDPSFW
jgi:enoyl-CoA hydratase/carnithine racemase